MSEVGAEDDEEGTRLFTMFLTLAVKLSRSLPLVFSHSLSFSFLHCCTACLYLSFLAN